MSGWDYSSEILKSFFEVWNPLKGRYLKVLQTREDHRILLRNYQSSLSLEDLLIKLQTLEDI